MRATSSRPRKKKSAACRECREFHEDFSDIPSPPITPPAVYHIPHEHFIVALAVLVIALCGVILSTNSVAARPANLYFSKANVQVRCSGPSTLDTRQQDTTTLTNLSRGSNKISQITRTDTCVTDRKVREYYCTKNGAGIASKVVECTKNTVCENGACVISPPAVSATTTPASSTPPALPPVSTPPGNPDHSDKYNIKPGESFSYWADGSPMSAVDGSWCQVTSDSTGKRCTDSTGATIYEGCLNNSSKLVGCGNSGWTGQPAFSPQDTVYNHTRCVYTGYDCSSFNRTCGAQQLSNGTWQTSCY